MTTWGATVSPMLASMTTQYKIFPFAIGENNSCYPYDHVSPLIFISPPLESKEKDDHIYVYEVTAN